MSWKSPLKPGLAALVFALFPVLAAPSASRGREEKAYESGPFVLEREDFKDPESGHRLRLRYKGEPVPGFDLTPIWSFAEDPMPDYPEPGCFTLPVRYRTRGVGLLLMSACPGRDYMVDLYSENSTEALRYGNRIAFQILERSFLGPESEHLAEYGHTGMSTAETPWMERLVVFDKGAWRLDRPGEFPEFYQERLDDGQTEYPTVGWLTRILSGEDKEAVFADVRDGRPEDEAAARLLVLEESLALENSGCISPVDLVR